MIDTDKYEGHTPAYGWRKADGSAMSIQSANNNADAELMADAPLLLAEVKRLRKRLEAFDCMRFDIEHAIDHSWASWEDLKVFLKEMIE